MDLFELAEARAQTAKQAAREVFEPDKKRRETLLRKVLASLESGPKTTAELILAGGHRFSVSVEGLRDRGHIIATEYMPDGQALYTHQGCSPTRRVSKTMQGRYYETDHWRETAKKRKEFDGWRCVLCHAEFDLETHHWIYNLFNESVVRDLSTLCRACHKTTHERLNIHFPKFVSDEIAERLTCPQK